MLLLSHTHSCSRAHVLRNTPPHDAIYLGNLHLTSAAREQLQHTSHTHTPRTHTCTHSHECLHMGLIAHPQDGSRWRLDKSLFCGFYKKQLRGERKGLVLTYSARGIAAHHGGEGWQQHHEAAAHIESAAGKQREVNAGAQPMSPFYSI